MKNFPNIEKLAGRSNYTGYCEGEIYAISKLAGGGWRAAHKLGAKAPGIHWEGIVRNTLEGISNELTNRAELIRAAKGE